MERCMVRYATYCMVGEERDGGASESEYVGRSKAECLHGEAPIVARVDRG